MAVLTAVMFSGGWLFVCLFQSRNSDINRTDTLVEFGLNGIDG